MPLPAVTGRFRTPYFPEEEGKAGFRVLLQQKSGTSGEGLSPTALYKCKMSRL
jgi:hypothetical protein